MGSWTRPIPQGGGDAHGSSRGKQGGGRFEGDRSSAGGDPEALAKPSAGVVAQLAKGPRWLWCTGKSGPSRLSGDGGSTRGRSFGSSHSGRRLRPDREKKVVEQNAHRKLRAGERRPLKVRLLGGLLLWV